MALVGPTASGKTALAVAVARRLGNVELVSADSMAVYRGMDVGTAKPTAAELEGVVVHMVDVADPAEDYSVARFQNEVRAVVYDIESRGHRALLVGGTGLYVQAVVDGLDVPGSWPELRAELEAVAAEPAGVATLHRRLAAADPVAAARIHPANARRTVRALEVTLGSGRPFSSFGPGVGAYPPSRFRLAGVWLPRVAVAGRIAARYRAQVEAGFVDEVRALASRPRGLSRTARQALGYRELLAHLAGECSLAEAIEEAGRRTRELSRRQRMWFRRDPRVAWFGAPANPVALQAALLEHWSA
ncbi:MAG: tRNA (adenosine(37)-N6)-dimethylallyltransferase MiaA [Actinomycetota bacterium]|jgi:tRNA dimethylallyltransferase